MKVRIELKKERHRNVRRPVPEVLQMKLRLAEAQFMLRISSQLEALSPKSNRTVRMEIDKDEVTCGFRFILFFDHFVKVSDK